MSNTEIIERIKRDGLWTPASYSRISTDIFFWSGSPGSITIISKTPHTESDEFIGGKYIWDKVRLMEPAGKIYPPDDPAIPAYIKEIYERSGRRREKAAKGYRHIPSK